MPIYVYEIIRDGKESGETFERVQSIKDAPLTAHPETGEPVRRVITAPNVIGTYTDHTFKKSLTNDNIARHGFTKYERSGPGQYVRTAGKDGPASFG